MILLGTVKLLVLELSVPALLSGLLYLLALAYGLSQARLTIEIASDILNYSMAIMVSSHLCLISV